MRTVRPDEALALWDGFPVDRQPRPIVLMGFAIGPGGGPTVEDKTVVLRNAPVVSDVDMPSWLLEALQPAYPEQQQSDPVQVRSVRRVYPEFRTDRGHRPLPAYRVEFKGTMFRPGHAPNPKLEGRGYPAMLALDPRVEATTWWPPGLDSSYRGGLRHLPPAVLVDGERTIRAMVTGSPPAYTDVRVSAVLESRTAVLLVIDHAPHPGVEVIPLAAVGRLVIASLSTPLGARVLLQADGIPIEVLPG
ncbi:hypothetical protein ACFV9C_33280 [Kribbella sp. NPDC059898]|uniref:hypothetical protein n=1 Tax=Kribbella sp. NPDC059898 TaxID=3346995 RepID=UPI003650D5B2